MQKTKFFYNGQFAKPLHTPQPNRSSTAPIAVSERVQRLIAMMNQIRMPASCCILKNLPESIHNLWAPWRWSMIPDTYIQAMLIAQSSAWLNYSYEGENFIDTGNVKLKKLLVCVDLVLSRCVGDAFNAIGLTNKMDEITHVVSILSVVDRLIDPRANRPVDADAWSVAPYSPRLGANDRNIGTAKPPDGRPNAWRGTGGTIYAAGSFARLTIAGSTAVAVAPAPCDLLVV